MVVCHPGITEVAKSKDTMVCTESTKGVAKPAKTKETSSKRCQSFARPVHPKLNKLYIFFWKGLQHGHVSLQNQVINLSTRKLMKPIDKLILQIHPTTKVS